MTNSGLGSGLDLGLGSGLGLGLGSVQCVILIEIAVKQKKYKRWSVWGDLFSKIAGTVTLRAKKYQ